MFCVENLEVELSGQKILSKISFQLNPGEIAILKGKSGSGKSTLLKAIAGMIAHSSGSISVDQSKIGYVFQDFQLFPHFNTLANVTLPLLITKKASKAEALQRANYWLERFGLQEQIYQDIETLSGGQKQRVAIARALVFNPELLLLDEPSSALDRENSKILAKILNELSREGITVLVATHDQEFKEQLHEKNHLILED